MNNRTNDQSEGLPENVMAMLSSMFGGGDMERNRLEQILTVLVYRMGGSFTISHEEIDLIGKELNGKKSLVIQSNKYTGKLHLAVVTQEEGDEMHRKFQINTAEHEVREAEEKVEALRQKEINRNLHVGDAPSPKDQ